jgi:hypothetical protein
MAQCGASGSRTLKFSQRHQYSCSRSTSSFADLQSTPSGLARNPSTMLAIARRQRDSSKFSVGVDETNSSECQSSVNVIHKDPVDEREYREDTKYSDVWFNDRYRHLRTFSSDENYLGTSVGNDRKVLHEKATQTRASSVIGCNEDHEA